jgi:hypothetical protein
VVSALLLRDSVEGAVERCNLLFRPGVIVGEATRRHHQVVFCREPCIVELHDQARIGDGLVLGAQRFAERQAEPFLCAVILVTQTLQDACRRHYRQKSVRAGIAAQRRLQIVDIALDLGVATVADRARHRPITGAGVGLLAALIFGVEIAEAFEITAGRRRWFRTFARNRTEFEAAEALGDVPVPGAFGIFAVIDHVETGLDLPTDHVGDGPRQILLVRRVIDGLAFEPLAHIGDELRWPYQASDMGCLDAVGIGLHR